ncbi:MAG: YueI family protein [Epulopiscium sp.]|nr:YueI family protein [Candidatus Epulonipiscium sp.]
MQQEDKLQQYLQQGILGTPELKREERQQYLGQFRERVLKIMRQNELRDPRYIDGMIKAFDDPRAYRLYIRTDEQLQGTLEFSKLTRAAQSKKLPFSFVDRATYQGDIAIVLVAEDAVDEVGIEIKISDLPLAFYQHLGKTICKDCYEKIQKEFPVYEGKFKKAGFWQKLFGYQCPIEEEHRGTT